MADQERRRAGRSRAWLAVRVAPLLIVAVGGALFSTFPSFGWWIAVVAVLLIVAGLVWDLRQRDRQKEAEQRPRLPDDGGLDVPTGPPHFVGPDHLRLWAELKAALVRPGTYLVTGPVGSGKTTLCLKVVNSVDIRRLFSHDIDGGPAEECRLWVDLSTRRPGAEVEDAIAHAVGADSFVAALKVLGRSVPTLLVLTEADRAFSAGDDPVLRRLAAIGGELRLVVSARRISSPSITWTGVLETTTLPPPAARDLFDRLAPQHRDHPAVNDLLARCDGLPLAVSILARVAGTVDRPADLAAMAARALRGAHDSEEATRLRFALDVAAAVLDFEEQRAWADMSQFPGGLGRDDVRPVLGNLADYHVARLHRLGLVARGEAGLRVPIPLRPPAALPADAIGTLWERFLDRGVAVLENPEQAGPWLSRQAVNLSALADLGAVPSGALTFAAAALEVDRPVRRPDLTESALVRLATAAMVDDAGAARVKGVATMLRDRNRWAAAESCLGALVTLHKRAGDLPATAATLMSAGAVALDRGAYQQAEVLLVEAQAIYDEIGDRLGRADARSKRGTVAGFRNDYEKAERLFIEAQGIYDKIGSRLGSATTRRERGTLARLRGDYEQAERLLVEAQGICDEIGNRLGGANSRGERGTLARLRGDYEQAERLLVEAQGICDEIGSRLGGANARRERGAVAACRNDYERAERLFVDAQGIYDEIGSRLGSANTRRERGTLARLRGDYEQAERLLVEAQGIYDEIGNRLGGANARLERGIVARRQGDDDQTERLLVEAQGIYERIGDRLGGAHAHHERGVAARLRGDLDEAESLLVEAQRTYDQIGARRSGANTRLERGEVVTARLKSGAVLPEVVVAGRRCYLEAEAVYGQIGLVDWQGRALLGAARCSTGDDRTALATRAASCLERSGKLAEARALEGEFGVAVSLGVVVDEHPGLRLSESGPEMASASDEPAERDPPPPGFGP